MQLDVTEGPTQTPVIFRLNDNGIGPELLQQVFLERGWTEYDEETGKDYDVFNFNDNPSLLLDRWVVYMHECHSKQIHAPDEWHLWWRTTRFRTGEYNNLLPWQHINHFPSCTLITKKDALCRNLRKMKIIHGLNVYNFSPKAFNLPNDYTKFVSEYAAHRQKTKKDGNPSLWICKPAESSRGRGIFVFHELSELQYDCNAVVQHYIDDPLLIGGYKFDIRVYVAIPSFQPLQIYIHQEGLVRFSTEKYDLDSLDNVFAHLTNTSINKFSPGYTTDKDEVGQGCKWTISQLRRYFLQNNIDDTRIWQQVVNIVVLTVLMQAPTAPKINNCFELYGFDILIDNSLKAWLLEVNFSPALSFDCQADVIAKKSMLNDLMSLIQIPETECDQSYYGGGGAGAVGRHSGSDLDTARTVSSTTSLVSHGSGMSFRPNNGYGKLTSSSYHNHSSDSHRYGGHRSNHTGSSGSSFPKDKDKDRSNGYGTSSSRNSSMKRLSIINRSPKPPILKSSLSNSSLPEEAQTPSQSRRKSESFPHLGVPNDTKNGIARSKRNSLESNGKNDVDDETFEDGTSKHAMAVSPEELSNLNISDRVGGAERLTDENSNNLENENNNNVPKLNMFGKGGHESDFCEEEERKYEVKVVKGNMKGQGWKKVVSPIPAVKQNKVTALALARRHQGRQTNGDDSSRKTDLLNSPQQRQQQQLNHYVLASPSETNSFHYTPSLRHQHHHHQVIPRNFTRLETSRFPHPHHHARPGNATNANPGKNGTAPLSRIPQKQVGNLFLVFPFNETTQKLSTGTMDPKLVIKEISRQDSKNRKAADERSSPNVVVSEGIWPSLRNV